MRRNNVARVNTEALKSNLRKKERKKKRKTSDLCIKCNDYVTNSAVTEQSELDDTGEIIKRRRLGLFGLLSFFSQRFLRLVFC